MTWLDQFQKGQISVKLDLSDLDRSVNRFDAISRLLAVAIVITRMVVGSAIAAGSGTNGGLSHVSDAALVLHIVSMAVA